MFRKAYLWWSLLLMALMVSGCAGRGLTLTAQDADRSLTLKPGDTFRVSLEGNPSTGYVWEVDQGATTVQVAQVGDPEFSASSKNAGAGGLLILSFKAGEPSQGKLVLVYRRPWETVPPEQTFTVNITIAK